MRMTVREAAEQLGYTRYTATVEQDIDDDGYITGGGDVDRGTILVEKTRELEGNRAWFRAEDGRIIEIAHLVNFS